MSGGFAVQPDKLAAYKAQVEQVVAEYKLIVGQLDRSRVTTEEAKNRLLGAPAALGPSGPPVDFTNSSRTLLTNYDMLLGALRTVHAAVGAKFEDLKRALGDTHESYLRIESNQANVFQNLLDDRPSDGS